MASSAAELTWEDIENRQHPRTMALSCIYEEARELGAVVEEADDDLVDSIGARFRVMATVLEQRLDPHYPDCPHCDQPLRQTHDGTVVCENCHEPLPQEVRDEWEHQDRRLWGYSGHGGNHVEE